jgi:hypothetical protein
MCLSIDAVVVLAAPLLAEQSLLVSAPERLQGLAARLALALRVEYLDPV